MVNNKVLSFWRAIVAIILLLNLVASPLLVYPNIIYLSDSIRLIVPIFFIWLFLFHILKCSTTRKASIFLFFLKKGQQDDYYFMIYIISIFYSLVVMLLFITIILNSPLILKNLLVLISTKNLNVSW